MKNLSLSPKVGHNFTGFKVELISGIMGVLLRKEPGLMTQKRRRFTAEFKASVVRVALREDKTLAQLAKEYQVHPSQITEWKRQALEAMPEVFSKKREHQQQDQQALVDRLTHKVHIIEANGASYRLEQSRRRLARRKKTTQ